MTTLADIWLILLAFANAAVSLPLVWFFLMARKESPYFRAFLVREAGLAVAFIWLAGIGTLVQVVPGLGWLDVYARAAGFRIITFTVGAYLVWDLMLRSNSRRRRELGD